MARPSVRVRLPLRASYLTRRRGCPGRGHAFYRQGRAGFDRLWAMRSTADIDPLDVLRFLRESMGGGASAPALGEIAAHFGRPPADIRRAVDDLRGRGYVEGAPRGGRVRSLTEKAARLAVRESELRAALEPALEEAVDLPTLFHVAQENLPHQFGMERGCLWLKDPSRRRFLGAYDMGLEAARGFRDELPLKCQGLGEPLWIGDRSREVDTAVPSLFEPQVGSILIIPIAEDLQLLGILAFVSGTVQGKPGGAVLHLARLAGKLLAAPLRRAEAQFRVQEDLKLHRLLLDLVRQMGAGIEIEVFLRRIFGVLEKLVPVDAMFVALRRPDGLYDAVLETDLDDADRRVFFPVPRLMEMTRSKALESVVGHRYLLICRTPEELAKISGKPASGDPWYPVGNPARRSASLLYVPLWCGEEFKGVLSVQSYRMNAYRFADAERIAAVGEYVGLAIRNSRFAGEAKKARP